MVNCFGLQSSMTSLLLHLKLEMAQRLIPKPIVLFEEELSSLVEKGSSKGKENTFIYSR